MARKSSSKSSTMQLCGRTDGGKIPPQPKAPMYNAFMMSAVAPTQRIPRPPNAFMLFANEHRKSLAKKYPRESNKEISIRLGKMWRCLAEEIKREYHDQAKVLDKAHKEKYPDYVYNPRDARMRKQARRQRMIAGQNLARAMTQHMMLKEVKSTTIKKNEPTPQPKQLPIVATGIIPMRAPRKQIHKPNPRKTVMRETVMRETVMREQVLRSFPMQQHLGEKCGLGYILPPPTSTGTLPSFQTFMTPHPFKDWHLVSGNLVPTVMNPTSLASPMDVSSSYPTLSEYCQGMMMHSNYNADQELLTEQHQYGQLQLPSEDTNDMDATKDDTESIGEPPGLIEIPGLSSDCSTVTSLPEPKNPLLTLANEALSQLIKKYPASRLTAKHASKQSSDDEQVEPNLEKLKSANGPKEAKLNKGCQNRRRRRKNLNESQDAEKENIQKETLSQRKKQLADKILQRQHARAAAAWEEKLNLTSWIKRSQPMYLVHPSSPTTLMAFKSVKPSSMIGCQSCLNDPLISEFLPNASTPLKNIQLQLSESPPTYTSKAQSKSSPLVSWSASFHSPLLSPSNSSSKMARFPMEIENSTSWPGDQVFYVPITELVPAESCNSSAMSFLPCDTNSVSYSVSEPLLSPNVKYYVNEEDENPFAAVDVVNVDPESVKQEFTCVDSEENASPPMLQQGEEADKEKLNNSANNQVFGHILSSTMEILNEEDREPDNDNTLKPTCELHYDLMENVASPNQKLEELMPLPCVSNDSSGVTHNTSDYSE